jgi:glycosyltransferase involved in cell wall biosynthesis
VTATAVPRTLFVGSGAGGVCWYRVALPAMALGADWLGVTGRPGALTRVTGSWGTPLDEAAWAGYDVVVLQLVHGPHWKVRIAELQEAGVTVLYEIDDDLRGVAAEPGHEFAARFDPRRLHEHEAAIRACDGVICSTPALAERLAALHDVRHVCANGIDLGRYPYPLPRRETVTIGWAGGTGHERALRPWLGVVADVLAARPQARWRTVGQPFALELAGRFGAERCSAAPFAAIDTYPAAMAGFDIALAPAAPSAFFAAKSDLRFLEAAALGLPVVADPAVYPTVVHGETGLHAGTPEAARDALLALVDDAGLRARLGAAARGYVERERAMPRAAGAWAAALAEVKIRAPQPTTGA